MSSFYELSETKIRSFTYANTEGENNLIRFWLYVILLHKIIHAYSVVIENIVTDSPFTNSHSPIE